MAAIEPVFRSTERHAGLLRQATRGIAVAAYAAAVLAAVLLVRPAFRDAHAPVVLPAAPVVAQTDVVRKHETVASFAARHKLELGDLLALNPSIDSLDIPAGTKLRVG